MKFEFKLRRDQLVENDEKKTDKDMCVDWIKAAYAAQPSQSDPFLHLLWNSLLTRIAAAEGDSIDLTRAEFTMLMVTLVRANFNAAGNSVYCQLLSKVGVSLE